MERKMTIEISRKENGQTRVLCKDDTGAGLDTDWDMLDISLGKMDLFVSAFVLSGGANPEERETLTMKKVKRA